MDSAEEEKDKAQDAYDKAASAQSTAQATADEAAEAVTKAKETLGGAEGNLEAANDLVAQRQEEVGKAQDAVDSAKKEKEEADAAIAPLQEAVDKAEQALKDAAKDADAVYAEGIRGFYEWLGNDDAVAAFDSIATGGLGATAQEYFTEGGMDKTTSPYNLDNMRTAIEIMKKCNELRAAEGVDDLQVNTYLMVLSAASTDYADGYYKDPVVGKNPHAVSSENNVGENLAWPGAMGVNQAFNMWYTWEKITWELNAGGEAREYWDSLEDDANKLSKFADRYPEEYAAVGHYLNIAYKHYKYFGAGYTSTDGTCEQSFALMASACPLRRRRERL